MSGSVRAETAQDPPGAAPLFVGRGPELESIVGQVAKARAGTPSVVVVEGPAGIGKTALVRRSLELLWLLEPKAPPLPASGTCRPGAFTICSTRIPGKGLVDINFWPEAGPRQAAGRSEGARS